MSEDKLEFKTAIEELDDRELTAVAMAIGLSGYFEIFEKEDLDNEFDGIVDQVVYEQAEFNKVLDEKLEWITHKPAKNVTVTVGRLKK